MKIISPSPKMSPDYALIKAFRGERYHITDGKVEGSTTYLTRCRRKIDSLTESGAIHLEEDEICQRCGSPVSFNRVNDQRRAEEETRRAEHLQILASYRASLEAHNAVRPGLADEIERLLIHLYNPERLGSRKTALNADTVKLPVIWQGQTFTLVIDIWNGSH